MRAAMSSGILLAAIVLFAGTALAQHSPGTAVFLDRCAVCHSVGGGELVGPDLLPTAQWPREVLRVAIKKMEENTGPIGDADTDALIDLLKAPDAKRQLEGGATVDAPPVAEPPPPPASAENGRKLFFGERQFAKGGLPCFACHAVAGRGGNLAVDLTGAGARIGQKRLTAAASNAVFPLMKSAYMNRPLAPQEVLDVVAFLEQAQAPNGVADRAGVLHAGASGAALVALVGTALLFRSRRAGFRSRVARKSPRR
jgi:mono/diheme cytochrome c family protein